MNLFRPLAMALLLATAGAHAQEAKSIVVSQAIARATVGKQANGAVYLTIENRGKSDDALLSATSPAASMAEIHTLHMEGDVMKMRALEQLPLRAGQKVTMTPGQGAHLMLIDLDKPLLTGEKFPVTLAFRKAGQLQITVEVTATGRPVSSGAAAAPAHAHHQHHNE